jgi:hypothetical protein
VAVSLDVSARTSVPADVRLRQALIAGANTGGGWGYYAGKASRLEPTCWAILALDARALPGAAVAPHREFLARCQQTSGWLVEDSRWPINIAFNALAAFTWLARPELATDAMRARLLTALTASKGIQAPQADTVRQDNQLQGWPWNDATFSWAEPTSWGLLALKKARRSGVIGPDAPARVAEAERLLIDRACTAGGWNFGNASVMHQNLRPYVPTTAIGLLAMQDRRAEPVVARGLTFLEEHWSDEISTPAMALSIACLRTYGRQVENIQSRLRDHVDRAESFGNLHGMALALFALSAGERSNAFQI